MCWHSTAQSAKLLAREYRTSRAFGKADWHSVHRSANEPALGSARRAARAQFCAPPMPSRASVTFGGCSTICEKRTTVTMSSIETSRA
jgi:hypothetical protein